MNYRVYLSRAAERDLRRLEREIQERVLVRLKRLGDSPTGQGTKPLSGASRGLRSLRIGRYRACYQVEEDSRTVTVLVIGHRREIYRRLERRRGGV